MDKGNNKDVNYISLFFKKTWELIKIIFSIGESRISQSKFLFLWLIGYLGFALILYKILLLFGIDMFEEYGKTPINPYFLIYMSVYMVYTLRYLGIKRMHDSGNSGRLVLIPFVNFIYLWFAKGDTGDNKYGKQPEHFIDLIERWLGKESDLKTISKFDNKNGISIKVTNEISNIDEDIKRKNRKESIILGIIITILVSTFSLYLLKNINFDNKIEIKEIEQEDFYQEDDNNDMNNEKISIENKIEEPTISNNNINPNNKNEYSEQINIIYDGISISYPSYFQVDTGYFEYLDYDNTLEIKKYSFDDYINTITNNNHGIDFRDISEQENDLKNEKIKYNNLINNFLESDFNEAFTGRVSGGWGYQLGHKKINVDGYYGMIVNYYDNENILEQLRTELVLFVNKDVYSFVFQYNFGETKNFIKELNNCHNKLPLEWEKDCNKIINGETYIKHFFEYKRDSLKNTPAESFETNYDIIMKVINSIKVK